MPKFGTYDEIANFMLNDWWGASGPRKWNIAPGGTITVNITGLSAGGQALAVSALQLWEAVANLKFEFISGAANITFDDNQPEAFFSSQTSGGFFTSARINVDVNYRGGGKTLDSDAFFAYVHEIGHVLGLGHPGHYDGANVSYQTHAFFTNDSYQLSTMSYFSQSGNPNVNASRALPLMPMIADIIAVQSLYGAAPDTRSGDTTYGVGSNAGSPLFDPTSFPNTDIAVTIYDAGGVDTLNYPGYAAAQVFNLNAEGISSVAGLSGNVIIARGVAIENAIGGDGDDTMIGNALANELDGGPGKDSLSGGSGSDVMLGGDGDDILSGGVGADSLAGGAGSDSFLGGAGSDFLDGGDGVDIARYSDATSGVAIRLWNGTGANNVAAGDVLANIENVAGSGFGDLLFGADGAANRLEGAAGNDYLAGLSGNDLLIGGFGADTIDGGAGADTASYSDATHSVTIRLWNGTGANNVAAGDILTNIENLIGGKFADNLVGADIVANFLDGSAGNDYLQGLSGADTLVGGSGNDSLAGGSGADRHDFAAGSGADRVFSFIAGAGVWDVIRITGYGAALDSFAEILAATSQIGTDAVINLGGGNTITLVGVLKSSLVADDFAFV